MRHMASVTRAVRIRLDQTVGAATCASNRRAPAARCPLSLLQAQGREVSLAAGRLESASTWQLIPPHSGFPTMMAYRRRPATTARSLSILATAVAHGIGPDLGRPPDLARPGPPSIAPYEVALDQPLFETQRTPPRTGAADHHLDVLVSEKLEGRDDADRPPPAPNRIRLTQRPAAASSSATGVETHPLPQPIKLKSSASSPRSPSAAAGAPMTR